jgi:arylsulfatase A-like enzyme
MRSLKKTKNMTIPLVRPSLISFVYLLLFYCLSLASDHVVIVVMDGARYSETMGDKSNVPNIAARARQGTTLTNFRTFLPCSAHTLISETIPGHSRITTGTYQDLYNDGSMLPTSPSIFQYYRKEKRTIPHPV